MLCGLVCHRCCLHPRQTTDVKLVNCRVFAHAPCSFQYLYDVRCSRGVDIRDARAFPLDPSVSKKQHKSYMPPTRHRDPAALQPAGLASSSVDASHRGKACVKPPAHYERSASRRKAADPAMSGSVDHVSSLLRPTASSSAKQSAFFGSSSASASASASATCPVVAAEATQGGAGDDVGTRTQWRATRRRAEGAVASQAHLRGGKLLSPRSPLSARIAARVASRLAGPAAKRKLVARGLEETPVAQPPPALKPRSAPPYAVDSGPANGTGGAEAAPPPPAHRTRRHVDPAAVAAEAGRQQHASRRRFCKPFTPRYLFTPRSSGRVKIGSVPPGGKSTANVLAPNLMSPRTAQRRAPRVTGTKHVPSAARVDHEPIRFGEVGRAALLASHGAAAAGPAGPAGAMSTSASASSSRPAPEMSSGSLLAEPEAPRPRGVRRESATNNNGSSSTTGGRNYTAQRTATVGAQGASAVSRACPFDASYAKSPFAPPTARGVRHGRMLGVSAKPNQSQY